eukprot:gene1724-2023_t
MTSNQITVIPPHEEHAERAPSVLIGVPIGADMDSGVDESKGGDLGEGTNTGGQEEFKKALDECSDLINERDEDGFNALLIASSFNNDDAVELLLERGATLNAISREGYTALMYAATNSNKRILEMLVAKGADQAVRDKERIIVVLSAAATNNVDAMAKLLDAGFDINSQDPGPCTATASTLASKSGSEEIQKMIEQ